MKKNNLSLQYLAKNIAVVFGIVLIWRGAWHLLDELDKWIFGGSHIWTALSTLR